jgi:hypothetical protein
MWVDVPVYMGMNRIAPLRPKLGEAAASDSNPEENFRIPA